MQNVQKNIFGILLLAYRRSTSCIYGSLFKLVMALEMKRHPCGIIYTKDFAHYLQHKEREESSRHPGELLSLEYVGWLSVLA